MKRIGLLLLLTSTICWARNDPRERDEAEYYVTMYARHYHVPLEFVRAVVEEESGWHRCPVSSKGAAGLMQLMPETAIRLQVRDRCDLNQNVSGGVRYLAWLMTKFNGDLRLVAAAYYTGETRIEHHGLGYSNPDVVSYVARIRARFELEKTFRSASQMRTPRRAP